MVIVAHPDDEVIGAGARMPDLRSTSFVHVTNGAKAHSGPDYAARRGSELIAALKIAGLSSRQLRPIGWPDQALSRSLVDLTRRISSIIAAERPDAVLTHPYEGGHPDHDATAFAVHAACRAMPAPPPIIEMAFYHQGAHGIRTGEFLDDHDAAHVTLPLSSRERELKRRLLNCFVSQAETLGYFSIDVERFRVAPWYDFTQPPHVGRLFYENFNWGVSSGAEWCALARAALSQLQAR
jgi:LmbE family N-acetylglucosaminyl deacetylase